jgi:hypothetical protein
MVRIRPLFPILEKKMIIKPFHLYQKKKKSDSDQLYFYYSLDICAQFELSKNSIELVVFKAELYKIYA